MIIHDLFYNSIKDKSLSLNCQKPKDKVSNIRTLSGNVIKLRKSSLSILVNFTQNLCTIVQGTIVQLFKIIKIPYLIRISSNFLHNIRICICIRKGNKLLFVCSWSCFSLRFFIYGPTESWYDC